MTDIPLHLGKSYPRRDALEKVTGQAQYVADTDVPNLTHGRIVRSPHLHARILRIETAEALAVPGVIAVQVRAAHNEIGRAHV